MPDGRATSNRVRRSRPRRYYETVVILRSDQERPRYHRRGEGQFNRDLHRMVWWTACGQSVGFWSSWLRRHHAEAIADPCRRCFPEGER